MSLKRLIAELRRRHVFKVAIAYALVAWIVLQVGEVAFEPLGLPDWTLTLVIVLVLLFFPLAMILAWAFDVTPEGVVRTPSEAAPSATVGRAGRGRTDRESRPGAPRAGVSTDVLERSIVVLPFSNMSAQAENEYLSDGIAEDLIIRLSKVGALRVISRTSAWQYKDRAPGARAIGDELGVAYILTGSVRRSGERLRIAAELIDAREDDHLWAETYDRDARDVFAIQADVATSIITAVDARIARAPGGGPALAASPEATRRPTTDLRTYDAYLRGRHHWNRRTAEDMDRAIEALDEAIASDPNFMLAHAGLADAYLTLGIYGARAPHEVMPRARAAADRALALDPDAAEALTARACVAAVYEWDWPRAGEDFRRAVGSSPPYVTARVWYAMHHLVPLRRFAEAGEQLDAALSLDPLSATVRTSRAALPFYAGDPGRAAAEFRDVVGDHPAFGLAHMLLGLSLVRAGRAEDAIPALERARELSGDSVETAVALGRGLAAAGREEEARALLDDLTGRQAGYVSATRVAQLHTALGEVDAAVEALRRALDERATDLVWLDVAGAFDPLRDHPEFGELRARVLPARG